MKTWKRAALWGVLALAAWRVALEMGANATIEISKRPITETTPSNVASRCFSVAEG